MNLSEMLSYADIGLLGMIAKHYDCDCSGNSKNELIQAILTALNRKETFELQLQELTDEDIRLMNRLLFDQRQYFSIEELSAIVKQGGRRRQEMQALDGGPEQKAVNPRETISKFKHRGWLFNGHSHQTKYLFRVPEDVKWRFRDCYTSFLMRKLVYIEDPAAYRDEQMIIVQDTRAFLRYVHQNEIALTVDGTMYKRSIQQILSAFHVQEEPVKTRGWRFGYGRKFREYPNRFSFIYDYCFFTGLIEEDNHTLKLTSKGEERVLHDMREDPMEMYRLWLKLYKGPIPNLQALVYWLQRLCRQWATLSSLTETLKEMIQPFYYDTPEQIMEQRVIQMMMHLGIIQVGEDQEHGTVVRMSKFGDSIVSGTYVAEEEVIEIEPPSQLTLYDPY